MADSSAEKPLHPLIVEHCPDRQSLTRENLLGCIGVVGEMIDGYQGKSSPAIAVGMERLEEIRERLSDEKVSPVRVLVSEWELDFQLTNNLSHVVG